MTAQFAQLLTIPQLAARWGRSRSHTWRIVLAMHERHGGDWLVQTGGTARRRYRINETLLRRQHPELYAAEELRDLDARVTRCEADMRELRRRVGAVGARVRAVAQNDNGERGVA